MGQYRDGTVTVELGNVIVTGTGTTWLGQISAGDMLTVGPDGGPAAFVAAILSNTQLQLESVWPGASQAGAAYAIVRDFDPTTRAPLMARGETNVVTVFNRAVAALSIHTATAVAGSEAVQAARDARDAAQLARGGAEDARDAAAGSADAAADSVATVQIPLVQLATAYADQSARILSILGSM